MMHDVVVFSLLHGGVDSPRPWIDEPARQVPVPVARLRPPFRDHREPRHRDDHRADARGRPRRRPDRGARRRRPGHQGHVVRAGVLQPDRRHVLLGDGAAARPNADGRNRFPAVLGQRLRGAHADPRFVRQIDVLGLAAAAGNPNRPLRVRVDVEDHLRRCGRQLLRRLAGQHRLVPAARREEVDRPRQGQPAAPPAVLRRRRRGAPADAASPGAAGARSSRWSPRSSRTGSASRRSRRGPTRRAATSSASTCGPAPPGARSRWRRTRASP